jgi:hypothetical protein
MCVNYFWVIEYFVFAVRSTDNSYPEVFVLDPPFSLSVMETLQGAEVSAP